ncbi:MAG: T9SS type A sorting domain-containing protein [Bacteroidales bacterium]|nr:T9SS type A sorting domain-containing protein [Bacteroidales bacterium]
MHFDGIEDDATATVYDITGRNVMEATVKSSEPLNVAGLAKGVYTLMTVSV